MWLSNVAKKLLAVELLGFLGAYALFQKMNNSSDFRSSMNRRFPSILEVYYKSNELAGCDDIRERDRQAWASKHD